MFLRVMFGRRYKKTQILKTFNLFSAYFDAMNEVKNMESINVSEFQF